MIRKFLPFCIIAAALISLPLFLFAIGTDEGRKTSGTTAISKPSKPLIGTDAGYPPFEYVNTAVIYAGPIIAAGKSGQDPPEPNYKETKIDQPVILDIDDDFLSQPLPPANPDLYKQWKEKALINVGEGYLTTMDLTGDGQYILAMSQSEATARVYLRETRKLIGNFQIPGFRRDSFDRGDIIFWPGTNDEPMFLAGNTVGLNLFDALTGNLVAHLHDSPVWSMRWSPDGRILICVVSDIDTQTSKLTFFKRISPQSLEEIKTIPFENRVDGFVLTRDNRFMAVTLYPSDQVELIDLHTGEVVWSIPAPEYASTVDISPDGRIVAVGGGSLSLIDINNPLHCSTYRDFQNNIDCVRFSPSGDAVAVSSYDGHIRIISTEMKTSDATLIKDLRHAGISNVYSLVFGRDGSFLVSSSGDRTIRFWGK